MYNKNMPIILNGEQESWKDNLLKQSLREELTFRLNKNTYYQNKLDLSQYRYLSSKNPQGQYSQWRTQSLMNLQDKKQTKTKFLPDLNNKRKSNHIEELSRQLLKYEQFDSQGNDDHKFRLSILNKMTKINFRKQKPTEPSLSPKTVNLKLQFPDRYEKIREDSEQVKNSDVGNIHFMKGSFYVQKNSQGLIPSIKKLVTSSFPKKSMFRSQSERQPYINRKIKLNQKDFQDKGINIIDQIKERFQENDKAQKQRRIKLAKLQRKLPLNFLSFSHRKGKHERSLQNAQKNQKRQNRKSMYTSIYAKHGSSTQPLFDQPSRLRECLFLSNKPKVNSIIT